MNITKVFLHVVKSSGIVCYSHTYMYMYMYNTYVYLLVVLAELHC